MTETRSRAFLYGESVFTTLRVVGGRTHFAASHLERLKAGARWAWPGREGQVERLWDHALDNLPGGDGALRVTLYAEGKRGEWGASGVESLLVDAWWTPGLPEPQDLAADCVAAPPRPVDWPCGFKTSDTLARQHACRGLPSGRIPLFVDADGNLAEFAHANLVAWDGEGFVTPVEGHQVLAGIGRARWAEWAAERGIPWRVGPMSKQRLRDYVGVWAVNAVRGPVRVRMIDGHTYGEHPIPVPSAQEFFRP